MAGVAKVQSPSAVLRVTVCCLMLMSDEMHWSAVNSPVSTAESPAGRHSHSAVVYQHRMWVYGGLSGLTALNDLWTWYFGKYSAHVYVQFRSCYFFNSWTSELAAHAHNAENFTSSREWRKFANTYGHREWVSKLYIVRKFSVFWLISLRFVGMHCVFPMFFVDTSGTFWAHWDNRTIVVCCKNEFL